MEHPRLEEATKSTIDNEMSLNLKTAAGGKSQFLSKENKVSSRAYSNRVNTLCSTDEKPNINCQKEANFVPKSTVSPMNRVLKNKNINSVISNPK